MNLTRRFALLSFVLVALLAVFFLWAMARSYESGVLEEAQLSTVNLVHTFVCEHVTRGEVQALPGREALARFDQQVRRHFRGHDFVRVKVFDPAGTVLYSDERALIGRNFRATDPELRQALEGEVVVDISDLRKPETAYEAGRYKRLLELGFPISFPGSRQVDAVLEVYQVMDPLLGRVAHRKKEMGGTLLGGLGLLWLSLYGIVRVADRRLQKAQRELEESFRRERRLEQQLYQSDKLLSLGQLSTGIAHEINNPMCGILSFLEIAQAEAERLGAGERLQRPLQIIHEQASRVRRITERVLSFARSERAQMEPVDVRRTLATTAELVRHSFEMEGQELRENYPEQLPSVLANADQLQEVFLNLAINARDAMSSGGCLTVTAARENGFLRLDFADTGRGVSAENRPRLFEPGFTTKVENGQAKGLGLGLFLCARIIESFRGTIEVGSEPDRGTTFTIRLPVMEDPL